MRDATTVRWPGWPAFAGAVPTLPESAKRHARIGVNGLIYGFRSRFSKLHTSPIIILGNQKSGTSAIAHLLADHGGLSKTIDIPPLWPPVGVEIMRGQVDFASVARRHRAYFSTGLIKEPMMTFFAHQVLDLFPEGRYVFVVRDPRDNIRSLLNRRQIPGHLAEIEERFVPGRLPHSVVVDASVWGGEGENYIGVLAHRWNKAVGNYFRHSDRMVLARYEDFVRDKVGFIGKMAQQLGVSQERDISDRADVQYQPAGDHGVSWGEFFGPENLERIERICDGWMARFGYVDSRVVGRCP